MSKAKHDFNTTLTLLSHLLLELEDTTDPKKAEQARELFSHIYKQIEELRRGLK